MRKAGSLSTGVLLFINSEELVKFLTCTIKWIPVLKYGPVKLYGGVETKLHTF